MGSVFLLAGCASGGASEQAKDKLEWLDRKAGEFLEKMRSEKEEGISSNDREEENDQEEGRTEEQDGIRTADSLTEEEKERIDEWLEENGYNRYGDSRNAIYPGGTPLRNEETGESMGRYEYILKKFPRILERIEEEGSS